MSRGPLLALAVFLLTVSGIGTARAEILYSVSPDDNLLRQIGAETGKTISSVSIKFPGRTVEGSHGLARDPMTDQLWALVTLSNLSGPNKNERELITVDPRTGDATDIGNTRDSFAGLAFDAAGTLYGVTGNMAQLPSMLFTLSKQNATPTPFLTLDAGKGEAIAFNSEDGRLLYRVSEGDSGQSFVDVIDLASPTTTHIPLSGAALMGTGALTYAGSGTFFLADNNGQLYRVTPDDWKVTSVAHLSDDSPSIRSKGLVPALTSVPEPASLILLGTGLAGWVGCMCLRRIAGIRNSGAGDP